MTYLATCANAMLKTSYASRRQYSMRCANGSNQFRVFDAATALCMARVRFGATSAIGREDDGAGAWIISPSLSGPPQHVLDRLPVPPPAARRPHPARVERLRDPVIGG